MANITGQQAQQKLLELHQAIQAEIPGVRREYSSLALISRLMRRHRVGHAEDAIREEARQRALRNKWADVTRGVA